MTGGGRGGEGRHQLSGGRRLQTPDGGNNQYLANKRSSEEPVRAEQR